MLKKSKSFTAKLARFLTVFLVSFMFLGLIAGTVRAQDDDEGNGGESNDATVHYVSEGTDLTTIPYDSFSVTLKDPGDIPNYTSDSKAMVLNKLYTATFDVNYYNTPLVAVVNVKLTKATAYTPAGSGRPELHYVYVYIDEEGYLRVEWFQMNSETEWDISIYKADPTKVGGYDSSKPYLKYFLTGIYDPDESDYIFNPNGRSVYYVDAASNYPEQVPETAANFYKLVSGNDGGFIRKEDKFCDFAGAIFAVDNTGDTFSFKTETPDQGSLSAPRLYSKKYNVIYDYNDDEASRATHGAENPSVYATSPNTILIDNVTTRAGYRFLGWNNETDNPTPEGQIPTTFKTTIDAEQSGDKTFKAYWEPLLYDVLFDANEASVGATSYEGDTPDMVDLQVTKPYNLRENGFDIFGYNFKGWSKESGVQEVDYADKAPFTDLFNPTAAGEPDPTNPVTLYAQWEIIKYQVNYDPNATDATGTMDPNPQTNLEYNKQYNLVENVYERKGYNFVGWSTQSGEKPVEYNDKASFTNLYNLTTDGKIDLEHPVTLYAQWRPVEYSVLYDANEASVGETSHTGNTPDQTGLKYDENYTLTPNGYKIFGYTFKGWSTEPGVHEVEYTDKKPFKNLINEKPDGSLDLDNPVKLYAQWEIIKYEVKYDPNADDATGTMIPNPQGNLVYKQQYNLVKNAYEREGYDWIGWSLEPGNKEVVYEDQASFVNLFNLTEEGEIDLEHPVTLYAQWKPWTYTIKYDGNGNDKGYMPDHVYSYFDANMISDDNLFERDGYRYLGFEYVDNNGNKLRFVGTRDFKELLKNRGKFSVLTLVAVWEKIPEPATKKYYIPVTGIKY